jgi:hypothetical protein
MVSDALYVGWLGALLVCLGGVFGLAFWGVGSPNYGGILPRSLAYLELGLLALGASLSLWSLRGQAGDAVSMGVAAWVAVTAGAGLYGATKSITRTDWHGSVYSAVGLLLGGRVIMASIAVVLLALADKEFPGQRVAQYPWRRSQVSIDAVRFTKPDEFTEVDWKSARRRPGPWSTLMSYGPRTSFALLIVGAFAPIAYAPPLRGELFGPLVVAVMPFSSFVVVASDLFWSLNPLAIIYIGVTAAVGTWGASFAWRKERPAAVLAAAVFLLIGGRVIAAVVVIVLLLMGSEHYGAHEAPHTAAKPEEGPAAH